VLYIHVVIATAEKNTIRFIFSFHPNHVPSVSLQTIHVVFIPVHIQYANSVFGTTVYICIGTLYFSAVSNHFGYSWMVTDVIFVDDGSFVFNMMQ